MKIIHVPFCFYPDPVGGTEVYVDSLVRHLQRQGVDNIIAAPGEQNQVYVYNQLTVRRYAVSQQLQDLREIYGEGDYDAALEFSKILDEEQPDLVHLHAFTRGVSLHLVRAAKQRNIPVIFTYHTPTVSCNRGTLMRWNNEICDGQLQRVRCARCVLHSNGLNRTISTIIGTLPPSLGVLLGKTGYQGSIWTALRMSELTVLRHATVRALFHEVDHVVVLANWVREVLLRNSVPDQKITLCRHGLAREKQITEASHSVLSRDQLRLIFLGRLDETKGIDIVIQSLQMFPTASIILDIYGILQNKEETLYQKKLKKLIAMDNRVKLYPPVAGQNVISLLQNYDLLVVPSRWLETGPLVILEAFAAGIPVIGSKLGGITEWVEDGKNGLLVEVNSAQAWVQVLNRIINESSLLSHLKLNINQPRSMQQVSYEMLALYRSYSNVNHNT